MNVARHFAATCAVVCIVSHALAGEFSDRDGNWWNTRSNTEKAIYTLGMIDGVETAGAMLTQKSRSVSDDFESDFARLFVKTEVKQLREGMDRFYSDFRNRRVPTSDALWLVALQISGVPEDEVERLTVSVRRASSEANAIELKKEKEKLSPP